MLLSIDSGTPHRPHQPCCCLTAPKEERGVEALDGHVAAVPAAQVHVTIAAGGARVRKAEAGQPFKS